MQNSIQGFIFCTACKGEKTIKYFDWKMIVRCVTCPLCKGTGEYQYKGKLQATPHLSQSSL